MLEEGKHRAAESISGTGPGGPGRGTVRGRSGDDPEVVSQEKMAPSERDYVASLVHRTLEGQKFLVVSFFLDGSEYAFEVSDAVEVLKAKTPTAVPRTPDFIKGIVSVRGEMVPVMDLKRRLGVGSCDDTGSCRVLVASFEELRAGFLVGRLSGVEEVPKKALTPPGEDDESLMNGFIKGIVQMGDRTIRLLSIDNLLSFTTGE